MEKNIVKINRVIRSTTEKVYRAFLEPDALSKWFPPFGFTCKVQQIDPVVGGSFKMSFTSFTNQYSHSFGGTYLELQPFSRIKYTDVFDDPNLPGEMLVCVDIEEVSCGVNLNIVQSNIPNAIPAEMCYLGWQESIQQLINFVEAKA